MTRTAGDQGTTIERLLVGGGEMGALTRAFDWSKTPVGPVEQWPRTLLTAVQIILDSRFPMFLWWGPELIQFYNDAYRPSLGAERHPSALGARGRECWAEVWPAIGPRIERVMSQGEAMWDENHRLPITRGGRLDEAYWTYSYSPVRDDDGEVGGVIVVVQETTARVRAERRLLVSERRLHTAFEHAATGLAITELDGGFVQVNPSYCRITGYAADELARTDILSLVHPEHRAEHGAQLARMLAGEIPSFVIDERYRRKDGSDIWVRKSVSMLPSVDGRSSRRVNLVEDIDASRKAEEERARLYLAERAARRAAEAAEARLASVFRQAPAFICVLRGPDHFVEMANDAYYQLVGFRDLVGRPLTEALPEVREQGFLQILDHVLETGETFVGTEVPVMILRSPGAAPEKRVITFVYQPLMEVDGSRSGIFVHGVDMTEQVLARSELEAVRLEADEARRRAEEANMARSQFLTMMSHELRTPLNAIGGYAQLLELGVRGPVTNEQKSDLARIQGAQQHLLGLINSVLNFAKLEAGHVHYDMADVPLMASLENVETLVAPQMRARGLGYTLRADPALAGDPRSIDVRADAEKLRQIMVNLLTNATKFTEPGGSVTVTVSDVVGESADDGASAGMVAITVTDTGIGIAPTRLESIFEPFVQVNRRLSSSDEGIGLGLAISRDLARAMDGDLVVRSELGAGSAFTLLLPRVAR
ncbi:MAG TPA: PAS domain S-box protein [Gemmatimonadaceae bacterium]|nr:PAS domain S-box protein [Gemmatimonadaceae bacterium]